MRMKRAASALLALCLTLSLCVSAFAAGTVLKIDAPETLPAVGGQFTAEVSVSGNPGINSVQLTLAFDASVVDCIGMKTGAVLEKMTYAVNPDNAIGATLAAASLDLTGADGVLCAFTFKVIGEGDPAFRIVETELRNVDGPNAVEVPFTVENGQGGPAVDPVPPVKPTPPVTPEKPSFTDVPESYWAHDYVTRAAELGLVAGYADGSFRPDRPVTRGQFVTMLWRMDGKPAAGTNTGFADVPADSWCAEPVAWASKSGCVNGVTAEQFQPNGIITREQAMAILFRYSGGVSGTETMLYEIYDKQFTDSAAIGSWARSAVYWAIYHGIVTGVTETTVVPKGTATRAQISAIFLRYMDKNH